MQLIGYVKKNYKICLIWLVFGLFVLGLLGFIYRDHVRSAIGFDEAIVRKLKGHETITLKAGEEFEQSVELANDQIKILYLAFDQEMTDSNADIKVSFSNEKSILGIWEISARDLQNDYTAFTFPELVEVECDKEYSIEISVLQGEQVCLYLADGYNDVVAYQIHGAPTGSVLYIFIIILIGTFLLMFISLICVVNHVRYERFFSISAFVVGLIFMMLLPPYFTPDEEYHFSVSYAASSELLGEEAVDNEGHVLVRETDYDYYVRYLNSGGADLTRASYRVEVQGFFANRDITEDDSYYFRTKGGASALNYIPEIIGITVARLLDLNGFMLFMAGRFMSLLAYTIIMYFAIKVMPFAKPALCAIGLFPMTIELVSSYNYDAIILPICFFSIAYILHLAFEAEKVRKRDFVILGIMVCILSWVKYLYVILFMMGLIIPEEKFGGRKKKICMAAGLIALGLLCILSLNLQSLQNYTSTAAQVVSWTDESKYTISHILSAPVHTFGVLLRTFYYNFNYYFSGAIGGHLGWLNLSIPEMLMMVFFVFFLIGMLKTEDSLHHEVKTSTKICALTCMGLVSATVFIGLLISWTRESSSLVEGIQGRYFLPIFR